VRRLGPAVTTFLAIVVVAAGISGVVLLAFPGSTGRYFSWALGPLGLAATGAAVGLLRTADQLRHAPMALGVVVAVATLSAGLYAVERA
jgi:peptidoglycan/LPS O-acetylase OafA/YrhL